MIFRALLLVILANGIYGKEAAEIQFNLSDVNVDSLKNHVRFLSEITPPRQFRNQQSLHNCIDYIQSHFSEMNLKTTIQKYRSIAFPHSDSFANIIAYINPEKPKIIVIGAHYDVCQDQPGADDNASGIAGLLEAARILSMKSELMDYQIQLVAYANEEPPFFRTNDMGSYIHAKSLKESGADVIVMISLEMIGYFTDQPESQAYPTSLLNPFFPSTGNFIAAVSNFNSRKYIKKVKMAYNHLGQLPCITLWAPSFLTGIDFSDHRNYWLFNFPAIMLTDTAFYRNLNYHCSTDTFNTLDFSRMAFVVNGLLQFLFSTSS